MAVVFDHYSEALARFLRTGFSFRSAGQLVRCAGVRERHELHDMVAETFRRVFEQRARLAYDGVGSFESYLRTVARNILIDRLRSAHARRVVALDDETGTRGGQPVGGEALSPEQQAEHEQLARLIRRFVSNLSPPERRFIALRYDRGLSQRAVAQQLSKSRKWVRTQETEFRRRLVAHLDDTGYLPHDADPQAAGETR